MHSVIILEPSQVILQCDGMQCALVKPNRHAELNIPVSCVY